MPKKLLVADDSITIQKVMGITFASEDYELTVVDNGADAILKAREIKPDLILADIVMPEKDGYEVCREIKNDPDLSATPVILLAGTFEQFDENKSTEVGADDHITKPFESQALVDKVNSNLEKVLSPSDTDAVLQTEEPSADVFAEGEEDFDEEIMELGEEDIVEATTDFSAVAADEVEEPESEAEMPAGDALHGTEGIESAESQDIFGEENVEDEFAEVGIDDAASQIEVSAVENESEPEEGIDVELEEVAEELGSGSDVDDELGVVSASDEVVEVEEMVTEEVAEAQPLQVEIEEELPTSEIVEEELIVEEEISYPNLPEADEDEVKIAEPSIGNLSDEKLEAIVSKIAKDVLEKIAWEVVPELAETLILEEIKRLKEGKSD